MMSCLWFEKLLPWNVHPCHLLGTSCARAAKRSSYTEDLHSIDKDIQMVHSPISRTLYLQGVRRSWTVMSGLFLSGPETVKKCVAVWTWRDLGDISNKSLFQHSHLSHWLHQCVPHHNRNICPTEKSIMTRLSWHGLCLPVPLCSLAKHPDVLLRQHVGGVPEVQLEQVRPGVLSMTSSLFYWELSPGVLLRQVNVDPLLKPEQ